jgi:hypothetical protein
VERESPAFQDLSEAPVLQAHIVGIIQVVHTDDRVAFSEKMLDNSGGDETGAACCEISAHGAILTV